MKDGHLPIFFFVNLLPNNRILFKLEMDIGGHCGKSILGQTQGINLFNSPDCARCYRIDTDFCSKFWLEHILFFNMLVVFNFWNMPL